MCLGLEVIFNSATFNATLLYIMIFYITYKFHYINSKNTATLKNRAFVTMRSVISNSQTRESLYVYFIRKVPFKIMLSRCRLIYNNIL